MARNKGRKPPDSPRSTTESRPTSGVGGGVPARPGNANGTAGTGVEKTLSGTAATPAGAASAPAEPVATPASVGSSAGPGAAAAGEAASRAGGGGNQPDRPAATPAGGQPGRAAAGTAVAGGQSDRTAADRTAAMAGGQPDRPSPGGPQPGRPGAPPGAGGPGGRPPGGPGAGRTPPGAPPASGARRSFRNGLIGGIIGGAVVALAVAWLLQPDHAAEIEALRARVADLDSTLAGTAGDAQNLPELASRIEALEQAAPPAIGEELQARLDALEQAPPGAPSEELQARLEALEQAGPDLAGLAERVDTLERSQTTGTPSAAAAERLDRLQEELAALSANVAAQALSEGDATASDLAVIDTLQARLAALEEAQPAADGGAALAAVEERLAALEASQPEPGSAEAVDAQLGELAARLDALEPLGEQSAGQREQLGGLASQLGGLAEQLQGQGQRAAAGEAELRLLSARLTALEERVASADGRRERGALLALATGQIDGAIEQARPFEAPLQTLAALAEDDPTVREALAALEPAAAGGVASLAELRRSFEAVAGEIVHEARAPAGAGLLDQATGNLMRLVSVRPVGAEVEGNAPGARVARAEARLAEGDLATAVAEIEALEGPAAEAAADWLAQARTRLEAVTALRALRSHATGLLAQSG